LAASTIRRGDAPAGEPNGLSTESAVDLMETRTSEAFPLSRIEDRLRRRATSASLTGGKASEKKASMRSTVRRVGGEKRRFAPDATDGRVEKTQAPGNPLRPLAAIGRTPGAVTLSRDR
jgi:hypothetical protein